MASVPPPYTPYGQDPRVLKYQRRMMRDQARAHRDQLRFQTQAMRRGSLLGPVLAIFVGVVFLFVETGHLSGLRAWTWYGRWWPLLLVLGGAILLLEWAFDRFVPGNPAQLYGRRRTGGAVVLLLILAFVGATLHQTRDWNNLIVNDFSINPDNVAEFFGSRHESDESSDLAFPAGGTLTVDNPHGDITISGTSTDGQIHLATHKQVYSSSDAGAELEARALSPHIAMNAASATITVPSRASSSANLTLTIPPTAALIVNANHGDVHIDTLNAPLTVTANHGDIALSSITGAVVSRVNNNGSSFSAHQIHGPVTLEGHADDLTLSDVTGAVSLTGDFYGDTHLEHIAGAIRFHTSRTDFQLARLDGQIEIGSEEITADQMAGPVVLTTRNRNLKLERVAGALSVTNRNGTVDLSAAPPLGNITVENRDGAVTLSLPVSAAFSLNATTEDGSIENDFSLGSVDREQKSVLTGTIGKGGPLVRLDNNHGDIAIRKTNIGPLTPTPAEPPVPSNPPARSNGRTKDAGSVTIGGDGLRIISGPDGSSVNVGKDGIQITSAP